MTEEKKKVTSSEDFITKSPLFVPIDVDGFTAPQRISFDCETENCGRGTTWIRVGDSLPLGKEEEKNDYVDWDLKSVSYRCFKCGKSSLSVVYRLMKREKRIIENRGRVPVNLTSPLPPPATHDVIVQVMKVGQYPEPSIEIPDGLEKNLRKESAALYKKSLSSRNVGYGLAALGYMRRVVEDKTNELIEVVAKYAEVEGVDAKTIGEIRQAAKSGEGYTPYEDKLKIASAVFPDSLKVGGKDGMNPLLVLFKLVSAGFHGKSEKECIQIAEEIDSVFQYLFTKLKADTEAKKEFIEKLKALS